MRRPKTSSRTRPDDVSNVVRLPDRRGFPAGEQHGRRGRGLPDQPVPTCGRTYCIAS